MLMPSIFGESLFDEFFDSFGARPARTSRMTPPPAIMKTDVKELADGFELHIDLPGYKKENVTAELKDGYLTVSASASEETEDKKEGQFIRRERFIGSCSRSFFVGEEIEKEDIKAKFEDGILKISIPKKEEKPQIEESKFITIEG